MNCFSLLITIRRIAIGRARDARSTPAGRRSGSNLTFDACNIGGEICISDADVKESVFISRSIIAQPWEAEKAREKGFAKRESHYAIHADRLKVGGRFSIADPKKVTPKKVDALRPRLPSTIVLGKIRLIGAQIEGALIIASAIVHSNRKAALSIIGARVNGLVSLSYSRLSSAAKENDVLATRAVIRGDFFIQKERDFNPDDPAHRATPGVCFETQKRIPGPQRLALRYLQTRKQETSEARSFAYLPRISRDYVIQHAAHNRLTFSESLRDFSGLGLGDRVALFVFDHMSQSLWGGGGGARCIVDLASETIPPASWRLKYKPTNLLDWNRLRVGLDDVTFLPNGIDLVGATIDGGLHAPGAIVGYPHRDQYDSGPVFHAERSSIGRGVYLRNGFVSFGALNFRRSKIGADFNCLGALMLPSKLSGGSSGAARATDSAAPTGEGDVISSSRDAKRLRLNRTLGFSGATIDGNLDLSAGRFVAPITDRGTGVSARNKIFAVYANRASVKGAVFCRNGFSADGAISFVSMTVGKSLFFEPMISFDAFLRWIRPDGLEAPFADAIGSDWIFDLEAGEVSNNLSLRCMYASSLFQVNDADDIHPNAAKAKFGILYNELREKIKREGESRNLSYGPFSKKRDQYFPDTFDWENIETRANRLNRGLHALLDDMNGRFGLSPRSIFYWLQERHLQWPAKAAPASLSAGDEWPAGESGGEQTRKVRGVIDLTNARTEIYTDDTRFLPVFAIWFARIAKRR